MRNADRKLKIGKALRFTIFFGLLILMIVKMGWVLRYKAKGRISEGFYALPKDSCDVVLLGPSMVQQGCYPMEMWKDYGITAYNLGSGNQSPLVSYYLAREAIETCHPKVLVLECGQMRLKKAVIKASYVHYATDVMPFLSGNRLQMLYDYKKEGQVSGEQELGLLFPFVMYHTNWKNLVESNFSEDYKNKTLGARIGYGIDSSVELFEPGQDDPDYELSRRSSYYLEKIMDLCEEEHVELFLVSMPLPGKNRYLSQGSHNKRYKTMEAIRRIAGRRGLNAVNLIDSYEELGIDPQHDTKDGQHLNYYGGCKFTDWLGNYLKEHYDLADHRDEDGYDFYGDTYQVYRAYVDGKLAQGQTEEAAGEAADDFDL